MPGSELQPLIRTMGEWGQRWVRSRFGPEDLDVALLMWDMKRSVRPENFPRRRIVVAFEFTEAPPNRVPLVAGERADRGGSLPQRSGL